MTEYPQGSEDFKRLNPHLFRQQSAKAIVAEIMVNSSKTEEKLNKTERRFLAVLRTRGYDYVGIQEITFRLGFDLRYCPDFVTRRGNEWTCWEVKGNFAREDSIVKLKAAATRFWPIRFVKAVWTDDKWIETVVPK